MKAQSKAERNRKANARGRKWRLANPEKYSLMKRKQKLKERYGLTIEGWDELFEAQNSACAICKTASSNRWTTDHCHTQGHVRGILCSECNLGIGIFKDCTTTLGEAINYLRSTQPR